ncbi:MAG: nucleoside deaminase [Coriobacteriia bacterium]|nr:nucleoside deaminase [Coriobacteriia bacterium]
MPTHEEHMRAAIELSREKMSAGEGGPFAALVVLDGEVVGRGWNRVTSTNDPTAHAEIVAIRRACEQLGTFSLKGAVIYSSCEPCPMCLAAIYWARVSKLYYANTSQDAAGIEFDDAFLYREIVLDEAHRSLPSERILGEEAIEVFREWRAKPDRIGY